MPEGTFNPDLQSRILGAICERAETLREETHYTFAGVWNAANPAEAARIELERLPQWREFIMPFFETFEMPDYEALLRQWLQAEMATEERFQKALEMLGVPSEAPRLEGGPEEPLSSFAPGV